ncbi:MAG: MATE family efflux transporter [Gammaproteobacteria bacterium CG_4_10_14_0_8_um_filter_38_16]|nr:MAG: MATE family efflux transporter [Gammaproteobacteria bacterium CG_4_10_14_0_8_um_filter_38_16]PJA04048.1 MAG: MATE family efflux transporter [Gammaproteobacteria bacterium CG_4_10_14_0_2_um_filter_38_22]PJB09925.1 MAG: MATE family efflux transporter [Gammaproteobacteria bacterium CG_4_9_14_3_um_filter_38_9]
MHDISVSQMKRVVQLSLPMAGSRFLQMFSGFIATMMVSHLGRDVLASCALINATLTVVLLVFISIVFSLSFIVGQSFGAKRYDEIGGLVQQGMLLSFILALIMMIFFWYADTVLRWFHQQPAMLLYVRQYFHALMWGVVPIMMQSCLEQFCYGVLKQRLVMIINFFSMLLGIPLAYILIFGKWGIPALGVKGLGLTFAIQAWFDFSLLLICCRYFSDFQKFELFKMRSMQGLIYLRKIFRIGWPMSVQFGGELGAFFVITMMIGWLGTNALAAVQITQQWMFLVIVPIFAMAEASGILVGQSVGAGELSKLNLINRASLFVSLGLIFIVDIGFVLFPHFLASFYMNTQQAKNAGILALIRPLFILMAITLIFNSIRDVISGSLRGLFDTQFPMQVGLFVMWCLVLPLGYFFAFKLHMNVIGFRLGGNIGLFIGALVIYWRWRLKVSGNKIPFTNALF